MPNFVAIGEVPSEKTVTKQKTHSELSIPHLFHMERQKPSLTNWKTNSSQTSIQPSLFSFVSRSSRPSLPDSSIPSYTSCTITTPSHTIALAWQYAFYRLIESRFYVLLDIKLVMSETLFSANLLASTEEAKPNTINATTRREHNETTT